MRKTITIFVSSPGDVQKERTLAGIVIERIQARYRNFVRLEPVLWEREAIPATAHFNEELIRPSDCDIFTCILWSRLGSPLPSQFQKEDGSRFDSGTEWELVEATSAFEKRAAEFGKVSATPKIYVYRRTAPPPISSSQNPADAERQYQNLQSFFERFFLEDGGAIRRSFLPYPDADHFAKLFEIHLEKVIRSEISTITESEVIDIVPIEGSPFRGLNAFRIEDEPLFFGRSRAIEEILGQIKKRRELQRCFVLIYGGSGFGKSSLMHAGVAARLTEPGYIREAHAWRIAAHFPGRGDGSPCESFSRALFSENTLPELGSTPFEESAPGEPSQSLWDIARLTRFMEEEPVFAVNAIGDALEIASASEGGPTHLCILLDQIEEIFTRTDLTDHHRSKFFRLLAHLCRHPQVWILATMRSEFFDQIAHYDALGALVSHDGGYILAKPQSSDLGRMIRIPALAAGLYFEVHHDTNEPLSSQILEEMKDDRGALPLLQFTLQQLYERRDSEGVLTWRAYDEIGGVRGAIAKTAEAAFARLQESQKGQSVRCFAELVTVSTEKRATRRTAELAPLLKVPGAAGFLHEFIEAKLLVTDEIGGRKTVEIAHEALITHWPTLAHWIDEHYYLLRCRARLSEAASLYAEESNPNNKKKTLLAGLRLSEALEVRASGYFTLSEHEEDLIRKSLSAAKLRSRLLRLAVIVFGALATFAIVKAVDAKEQQSLAENATGRATALLGRNYTSQADTLFRDGNDLVALPHLIRALELTPGSSESSELLHFGILATLSRCPHLDSLWIQKGPITGMALSGDGLSLITADDTGSAEVRSVPGFHLLGSVDHGSKISCVGIHPSGKFFFTGGHDGIIRFWEMSDLAPRGAPIQNPGIVIDAEFSPAGDWIAIASGRKNIAFTNQKIITDMKRIRVGNSYTMIPQTTTIPKATRGSSTWRLIDGGQISDKISGTASHPGWASHVTFDPSGQHLLSMGARTSGSSTAAVADLLTGTVREINPDSGSVNHGSFSKSGQMVALALGNKSSPGALLLVSAGSGEPVSPILNHRANVTSALFSPADENIVLTASDDGGGRFWDVENRQVIASFEHADALGEISFSPGGDSVLSASHDGSVRAWRSGDAKPDSPFVWHTGGQTVAQFLGCSERFATGGSDGVVRIWDPEPASAKPLASAREPSLIQSLSFSKGGREILGSTATVSLLTKGSDREAERGEIARIRSLFAKDFESGSTTFSLSPEEDSPTAFTDITAAGILFLERGTPDQILLYQAGDAFPTSLAREENVTFARLSPDKSYLAVASKAGITMMRRSPSGEMNPLFTNPIPSLLDISAFSPSGKLFVAVDAKQTVTVIDSATGNLKIPPQTLDRNPTRCMVSPDDESLLVLTEPQILQTLSDSHAFLWDLGSTKTPEILVHERQVAHAAFSKENHLLVTADEVGDCRVWDVGQKPVPIVVIRHRVEVTSCGFTCNPTCLVTGCTDGGLRFWNPNSGHLVCSPIWHPTTITALAISADYHRIATGCADGSIRTWELPRAQLATDQYKKLASLLLGKTLDDAGSLIPLTRESLADLWRDLNH